MAAQLWWAMAAKAQWPVGWLRDCNEQQWRQWAIAGVTLGDSNCGGMIAMGHNGGSAMDNGTVVHL
jgi:hypothetical protein